MRRIKCFLLFCILISLGCSSGSMVTLPQEDTLPDQGVTSANVLGAYELTIDTDSMTADLIPKRQSAIGESWTVSGVSYFTVNPCKDCFRVSNIVYDDGRIILTFFIRHPFEEGDPEEPVSGRNRLDLDIFDVALVIVPKPFAAIDYPLLDVDIPAYHIENPDGYTIELSDLIGSSVALPYVLAIDDSADSPPSNTFNKFEMGASTDFDIIFPLHSPDAPEQAISFDLYLTFGYGWSAVLEDRFDPEYYNPEFNRKPAWKVEVEPPHGDDRPVFGNTWDDNDDSTEYDVTIKVYDWQIGANVNPDLEEQTDVYAASEVEQVSVEIPGMTNALKTVNGNAYAAGGTGMPDSPLVYTIPIANENLLDAGEYIGLVAVYDERSPLDFSELRDYLIHTPDGGENLNEHEIPAYVTYQTFPVTVVEAPDTGNLKWAKSGRGPRTVSGSSITRLSDDSTVVAGFYRGTATFGEGAREVELPYSGGTTIVNAFVAKYRDNGNLEWATAIDGPENINSFSVSSLGDNSIVVTGSLQGTATFGAGAINETQLTAVGQTDIFLARYASDGSLIWATRVGNTVGSDWGDVVKGSDDLILVCGRYSGDITFGEGEANETILPDGGFFIARYNTNGTLEWAKRAGPDVWGKEMDTMLFYEFPGVSTPIVVSGYFQGSATFGEDEANETTLSAAGPRDSFIARYNEDGTLEWVTSITGSGSNRVEGIYAAGLITTESIFITGYFDDAVTFGEGEQNETNFTSAGGVDIFIARYNTNGTVKWAKHAGGSGDNYGRSIHGTRNRLYVTGLFRDTATFGEGDPNETHLVSAGANLPDIFVAKYSGNGSLLWAKRAGGSQSDEGRAIVRLSDNSTVAAGVFSDTATFGQGEMNETELISEGSQDMFIARFDP